MKKMVKFVALGLAAITAVNVLPLNALAYDENNPSMVLYYGVNEDLLDPSYIRSGSYTREDDYCSGYYYYEDGRCVEVIDNIVSKNVYYSGNYKCIDYVYASGWTSHVEELDYSMSGYNGSNIAVEESFSDEQSETANSGSNIALEETFGDDGYHSYEVIQEDGTSTIVEDSIVSEETYIEDGYEYSTVEYESGATATGYTLIEDDSNDEEDIEYFCDSDDDDCEYITDSYDDYDYDSYDEEKIIDDEEYFHEGYERGSSDEEIVGGDGWTYDKTAHKLYISSFKAGTKSTTLYAENESDFPWYQFKDEVELIAIEGIKEIYANAFKGYSKLKKVYVNNSLEYLSTYAFNDCPALNWLYINSSKCEMHEDSWTNLLKMIKTYDDNHLIRKFKITCVESSSFHDKCIEYGIDAEVVRITYVSPSKDSTNETKTSEINPTTVTTSDTCNYTGDYTYVINNGEYDITYLYQHEEKVYNDIKDNATGHTWGWAACVVCSVAMMVDSVAEKNGFVDNYNTVDEFGLVRDITYNDTYYNDPANYDPDKDGWDYKWASTKTRVYDNYINSDGEALKLGFTILYDEKDNPDDDITKEQLDNIIDEHPEGILVHVRIDETDNAHAVIIIGHDDKGTADASDDTYTIVDTGHLYAKTASATDKKGVFTATYNTLSNKGTVTTGIRRIYYINNVSSCEVN